MLEAKRLNQLMKFRGPLLKPGERLFGNLETLRIACLDVGLIQDVVPCGKSLTIARPDVDQTAIPIL